MADNLKPVQFTLASLLCFPTSTNVRVVTLTKIEVDTSTFVGVAKCSVCVSLRVAAKSLLLAPTGVKDIQLRRLKRTGGLKNEKTNTAYHC
ncbi:hypothetical protein [Mobiluncus mulieris]|uniref:hypothetical protein n=1 Tax=Mobiluncus mulieris TaxID=2052 RepID=UPI000DFD52BA|nr:hypothetical protein [Mobiluncus mulieris]STY85162.1 Uncharacterised protein [Mobiluncus mulieris]